MKKISTIIICLFFFSCRGPNEPIPPRANQFRPIYISGIYRTGEGGDYLGPMGNPQSPENKSIIYDQEYDSSTGILPSKFNSLVYPNPTDTHFNFRIDTPVQTTLTISLVRGIGWAENTDIDYSINLGNQELATPYGLASLYYVKKFQNPGRHNLWLDCSELPDGFYRIFVETDQWSYWHDFLTVQEITCENLISLGISDYFSICE